ncbi:AMP-binding enzyme family protein [Mycobacterium xenopi 3993]|nr:AMP-binding enzyme family protein [Mycobacterium xenopi 3993]
MWRTVHKHKVNLLFFTGDAMARPLLDALSKDNDYDLSSLYLLASTAALFSPSIKEKLLELLPNRVITDSIGSSETGFGGTSVVAKGQAHTGGRASTSTSGPWCSTRTATRSNLAPGAGGHRQARPRPGRLLQGPEKSAATFKVINGVRYAIPGDYATVEEDGTVTLLGRGSQSINSGGEKIYPEEVEAALKGHPDVFDALVVGVPDERYGQCVAAVVQPRPEHARPWPNSTSSCAARSPDTKCPQTLVRRRGQAITRGQAGLPLGQGADRSAARRRGACQPREGVRP